MSTQHTPQLCQQQIMQAAWAAADISSSAIPNQLTHPGHHIVNNISRPCHNPFSQGQIATQKCCHSDSTGAKHPDRWCQYTQPRRVGRRAGATCKRGKVANKHPSWRHNSDTHYLHQALHGSCALTYGLLPPCTTDINRPK